MAAVEEGGASLEENNEFTTTFEVSFTLDFFLSGLNDLN